MSYAEVQSIGRVPPHDEEAERIILGTLLLGQTPIDSAAEVLTGDEFYIPSHARIWQAIVALSDRGQPVNLVTVVSELKRGKAIELAGGTAYVAELIDGLPHISTLRQWARIVKDKAMLRKLLALSDEMAMAAEAGEPAVDLVERVQGQFAELGARAMTTGFRDRAKVAGLAYDELDALSKSEDGIVGLRTGLTELDTLTGGLRPGWLVIAAARTGEGKSVLGVQVADSIARSGGVAAVFSVEMDGVEVTGRRLLAEAGMAKQNMKYLSEQERDRLAHTMTRIATRSLFIDDSSEQSVPKMRAACRALRQQQGRLDVVVVDYLQILRASKAQERRHIELGSISADLKAMAKDLRVPVIALAQLSRRTEDRADRRPTLADLRESGSLEQDADVVILIWHQQERGAEQSSHLILAKNRHGMTGVVDVKFNRYFARFEPAPNFEQHTEIGGRG